MKLIEPPLAEPHERWCERSEIPQSEEFPPTRLFVCQSNVSAVAFTYGYISGNGVYSLLRCDISAVNT